MKRIVTALIFLALCAGTAGADAVFMTTSDYATGNTAAYDIATGSFYDNILPINQDTFVKTDGTYFYILEATGKNAVIKADPAPDKENPVLYHYSVSIDDKETNPHDIVFADSKAYVILYGVPTILVVNPAAENEAGFITSTIDISAWSDTDGSPEAHIGFARGGMVYVVLQMYDLTSYSSGTAVLLAVDTVSDTIVDLDDKTDGIQGLELDVKNPQWGSLVGDTLYLGGTTYGLSDEGVIAVDLDDLSKPQTAVLSESDLGGSLAGMDIFNRDTGVIYTYDKNWNKIPNLFDPATGTVGEKLPVPDAGGGIVMAGGILYVGSREAGNPGLYRVDSATNTQIGDMFPTILPPYSLVYVGKDSGTLVMDDAPAPAAFSIGNPHPNPFNPITTVPFTLTEPGEVTIEVYNAVGQKVDTLINTFTAAGIHSIVWNAAGRPSGIYHIRAKAGGAEETVKATIMK